MQHEAAFGGRHPPMPPATHLLQSSCIQSAKASPLARAGLLEDFPNAFGVQSRLFMPVEVLLHTCSARHASLKLQGRPSYHDPPLRGRITLSTACAQLVFLGLVGGTAARPRRPGRRNTSLLSGRRPGRRNTSPSCGWGIVIQGAVGVQPVTRTAAQLPSVTGRQLATPHRGTIWLQPGP